MDTSDVIPLFSELSESDLSPPSSARAKARRNRTHKNSNRRPSTDASRAEVRASMDLEALSRDELIRLLQEQKEDPGVRITFAGKTSARQIARRVQPRVTQRVTKHCIGSEDEQSRNHIYEGENLQAMTTLYRYRGQVDLIVTDPPYNTGEDFRYNDRWDEDPNDPDLGPLVRADDGARHTKWMKFMLPRLSVMRDMLKPSGVLAICIDQRELFRLGLMLDELFGESNRLGIINWQKTTAKNDAAHVSSTTEYVLVYAKDLEFCRTGLMDRSKKADSRFGQVDNDPEPWKQGDASGKGDHDHASMVYGIQSPFTGRIHYPTEGRHWAYEQPTMKLWLEAWGSQYVAVDVEPPQQIAAVYERARQFRGAKKKKKAAAKVKGRAAAHNGRKSEISMPKCLLVKGAEGLRFDAEGWPVDARGRRLDLATNKALKKAQRAAQRVLEAGAWPRLFFGRDGTSKPMLKIYKKDVKAGTVPTTFWGADELGEDTEPTQLDTVSWPMQVTGRSREGVEELDAILGRGHGFQTVKPMKLIQNIIQIWCPPTGLVLDPFAGSGTTAHAVLRLNAESGASRRFILCEQGRPERGDAYARSLTAERVKRVITGEWATGRATPLSGGFRFVTLKSRVDAKALLELERDEMMDVVLASHFDTGRRGGPMLVSMSREGYRYLMARNAENEGFYLVWEGADKTPVFNEAVYDSVVREAQRAGLKPIYHVYARISHFQSDDVRFYQIPSQILVDFGLSVTTDVFNEEPVEESQPQ